MSNSGEQKGFYEQNNGWAAGVQVQVTGSHACSIRQCFPDIGIDVEISSETKIGCFMGARISPVKSGPGLISKGGGIFRCSCGMGVMEFQILIHAEHHTGSAHYIKDVAKKGLDPVIYLAVSATKALVTSNVAQHAGETFTGAGPAVLDLGKDEREHGLAYVAFSHWGAARNLLTLD
eukprot:scaffold45650_cov65-Attheya_sp.AAC.1